MRLVLSTLMMIAGLACGTHGQPSKEKPMSVSERFAILSEQWAEHCRKTSHSSKIEDYLNDTSFRGLVELGPPAVPLIMEHYATDELRPWEFVLEEITKVKFIQNRDEIIWGEVIKKRLDWWEKEKAKKK